MKTCPTCKMTVQDNAECPFCYTTLTYEPNAKTDKEHYVNNKYFWSYMAKKCWFSLLCLFLVLGKLVFDFPQDAKILVMVLVLSLYSVLLSVFQRKLGQHRAHYVREEYAELPISVGKVSLGLAAVIICYVAL